MCDVNQCSSCLAKFYMTDGSKCVDSNGCPLGTYAEVDTW